MQADILVVDDVPENLIAIEATLERLGHNLVLVRSGEEALRRCREKDFAVVLLDVQLPDMDGFAVADRLRKLKNPPPIIFLTGFYREDLHVTRGYEAGAADYLFKPIIPEILRSKVSVFVELAKRAGTGASRRRARRTASIRRRPKTVGSSGAPRGASPARP